MYNYDVIVIGSGPAGMNAALYASRGGFNTLLLEKLYAGGQAATTDKVDNFLGFPEGISGDELTTRMEKQAKRFGARILHEEVQKVELEGATKTVVTDRGTYTAKVVIICTGARPRELGLENERGLRGMGVSYCATCDGAFFKGQTVAVAGGGDTACEDALFLARYCEKVYLIHRRDSLRGAKVLQDAIFKEPKIEVVWNNVVAALTSGLDMLDEITLVNTVTTEISHLKVSAVFVAVGTEADSDLFRGQVKMDDYGNILTDNMMRTNLPGVFAAGDVRKTPLRQIITAAADGAVAAYAAGLYITENAR